MSRFADLREPERLSAYHGMDVDIRLERPVGVGRLEAAIVLRRSIAWTA